MSGYHFVNLSVEAITVKLLQVFMDGIYEDLAKPSIGAN